MSVLTGPTHPNFGNFLNLPCSTSGYQSICETDFEYSICPPEKCPIDDPGYFMVHGKCFYFEKDGKNFKDAKENCKCKGGKLYEPKDAAKMKEFLKNSATSITSSWVVTGITDMSGKGNWAYDSNGQNINFSPTFMAQNGLSSQNPSNCQAIFKKRFS